MLAGGSRAVITSAVSSTRRLLRDVAEGRSLGDTTTLADPNVFDEIRRRAEATPSED